MHVSFARWPVTDAEIDPGSDMPKPIDQWSLIQAARQLQDIEAVKPGRWARFVQAIALRAHTEGTQHAD